MSGRGCFETRADADDMNGTRLREFTIHHPKLDSSANTAREAEHHFSDDHVHMLLLVDDSQLTARWIAFVSLFIAALGFLLADPANHTGLSSPHSWWFDHWHSWTSSDQ